MCSNKLFKKGWYVIHTKFKQEKNVFDQLSGDFNVFLPLKNELRNWSDRKKITKTPLFPSYIFIHLRNYLEYYNSLKNRIGIISYVKIGDKLVNVTETEIDQIRVLINNYKAVHLSSKDARIGELRLIKTGPFKGYECYIDKIKNKRKIIVRINSLNQNIIAEIDLSAF